METENKDWKPEVGKTAWIVSWRSCISKVLINSIKNTGTGLRIEYTEHGAIRGDILIKSGERLTFFPTPKAALASIKVYDLEGKEVVIPRAEPFLVVDTQELPIQYSIEKLRKLIREVPICFVEEKKPVTTLAQAQMLLYEHGMILDLSGLSPILIERGGAAIGGESDGSLKAACDLNESDQGVEIPWDESMMEGEDAGGKSDQREGGC